MKWEERAHWTLMTVIMGDVGERGSGREDSSPAVRSPESRIPH